MNNILSLPLKLKLFKIINIKNIVYRTKNNAGIFSRLKKESALKINGKIDFYLIKNLSKTKFNFIVKDLYSTSLLNIILYKHNTLKVFGLKKQYFYSLCHFFLAFSRVQNESLSHEIFSSVNTDIVGYNKNFKLLNLLLFNSIFGFTFKQQKHQLYFELIWVKLFKFFNAILIKRFFVYVSKILNNLVTIQFNSNVNLYFFSLEKYLNVQNVIKTILLKTKVNFQYFLKYKHIVNLLMGRISNWSLNNLEVNYLLYQRLFLLNKKQNINFIAKQGSFGVKKLIKYNIKNKHLRNEKEFKYKDEISNSLLYYIDKLKEKQRLFSNNPEKQKEILGLRNFFLSKSYQKFNNKLDFTLFPAGEFFNFYKQSKKDIFSRALNFYFSSTNREVLVFKNKSLVFNPLELKKKIQINNLSKKFNFLHFLKAKKTIKKFLNTKKYHVVNNFFWIQSFKKKLDFNLFKINKGFKASKLLLPRKEDTNKSQLFALLSGYNVSVTKTLQKKGKFFTQKKTNFFFEKKQQIYRAKKKMLLQQKDLWKQKKLTFNQPALWFKNLSHYFSIFLGQNVNLIFINALGIAKFGFMFQNKKKNAQRFLNYIERQMIQRYKYIAIYIQDFIRICFFSFFFKNPTFLTNFMGFQLAKLPKNRKETQFIRFLIKAIKIFAAHRREIFAIKIAFKGRVNRWRRTKVIRGQFGIISFITYDTRIEYGTGKAITRKGAIGIHLWICYKVVFIPILRATILGYIEYSQQMKLKTMRKVLRQYQLNTK